MGEILLSIVIVLLQLGMYLIIGNDIMKWMKQETKGLQTILVGFLGYFILFQLVALPLICLQAPFHVLVIVWGILCILVLLRAVVWTRKELVCVVKNMGQQLNAPHKYLLVIMGAVALFLIFYQIIHYYAGFDTAFYIGNINTTLYTDTMYLFDGETGKARQTIHMRYGLSGFYMNTAFWCKVFGIHPIIAQNYSMGSNCIFMAVLVILLIGKKIFYENTDKACIFTTLVMLLNILFVSGYSTADFLLYRGYEAKGFCANVIIPAAFYGILKLWEKPEDRKKWKMLFLVVLASVPVSMSAILIVPAIVGVVTITEWLRHRRMQIIWNGIVCVLPNVVYLVLYFLYTRKIWLIHIG